MNTTLILTIIGWIAIISPPTVETLDATNIGTKSATLHGRIVNDGGEDCGIRFAYRRVGTGSWSFVPPCFPPYIEWHGSYSTDETFGAEIFGLLSPDTTYEFRAEANNSAGTSYGSILQFTTEPINPPTVETLDATGIGQTSATLNGRIDNDGGEDCEARFEYRPLGAGSWDYTGWFRWYSTSDTFDIGIFDKLSPSTTYEFRAEARNSAGTSYGSILQFTTESPSVIAPSVSTLSASNIGQTSATLNGRIDDDGGESCSVHFRYLPVGGMGTWTRELSGYCTGDTFSIPVSNLTPGSTYEFSARAENSTGTGYGSTFQFTTEPINPPTVETLDATNIGTKSATLNGRIVNDGGKSCTVRFKYRPVGTSIWTDTSTKHYYSTGDTFDIGVFDMLSSDTTYEFRAEAWNSADTSYGSTLQFKTGPTTSPIVETIDAISQSYSATLRGIIIDDGGKTCEYQFECSEYIPYGTFLPIGEKPFYLLTEYEGCVSIGESFSRTVTGLRPNRIYEFRARARNSAGESEWGESLEFTTRVAPPVPVMLEITDVVQTLQSRIQMTMKGKLVDDGGEACSCAFFVGRGAGDPNDDYRVESGLDIDYWHEGTLIERWPSYSAGAPTDYQGPYRSGKSFSNSFDSPDEGWTPGVYHIYAVARNSLYRVWSKVMTIDVRVPVITEITGKHFRGTELTSHRHTSRHVNFLDGVSLEEPVTVSVKWNKNTPVKIVWMIYPPDLAENNVKFIEHDCSGDVNDSKVTKTFNVGEEFGVGGRLVVQAYAKDANDGDRFSLELTANFSVVPPPPIPPELLERLRYVSEENVVPIESDPNEDMSKIYYLKYDTGEHVNMSLVDEALSDLNKWIPDEIPILGGSDVGVYFNADVKVVVGDDSATLLYSHPISKYYCGGLDHNMRVMFSVNYFYADEWKISGDLIFMCNFNDYYDVLPLNYKGVGVSVKVGLEMDAMAELTTEFWKGSKRNWNGQIFFYPQPWIDAYVNAVAAKVESGAGGGLKMLLEFPEDDPFKQFCIDMWFDFTVSVLTKDLGTLHLDWRYCPIGSWFTNESYDVRSALQLSMSLLDMQDSGFHPMGRDYLDHDYAVWLPDVPDNNHDNGNLILLSAPSDVHAGPVEEEQTLQTNVFKHSEPTLAASDGELLLGWLYDDPSRSADDRTQIVFSRSLRGTWIPPAPIDDDGTADFSPQLAVLPNGQVLCVWQNANQSFPEDAELRDMAAAMEIAGASYNSVSGFWNTTAITSDLHLDHSPQIVAAANNTALLTWISNDKDDILGVDPNALSSIRYCFWIGAGWSEYGVATTQIESIRSTTLAYDGSQAVYVYSVDTDRDPITNEDTELYALIYDGAQWSQPIRLTNDNIMDINPQVIYYGDESLLVWYRGDGIVSCHSLDTSNIRQVLQTNSVGAMGFRLASGPNGMTSLVWPAMSLAVGNAEVFIITYDSLHDLWSHPYMLTDDMDEEKALTATYVGSDELALVYNKNRIRMNTDNNREIYQTDLCLLRHELGRDLAITNKDISFDEPNPIPGSTIKITATIHNLGDIVEVNVPVGFYYGDPFEDGELIGDLQTISEPILAGGMGIASISWTIPQTDSPKEIYVVVFDTADSQTGQPERDWNNNIAFASAILPDLDVEQFYWEQIGYKKLMITAMITNVGFDSAHDVGVTIHKDSVDGAVLKRLTIPTIGPGETEAASWNWDIISLEFAYPEVLLYAVIDENNTVAEANENNNTELCFVDLNRMVDIVGADSIEGSEQDVLGNQ